MRLDAEWRRVVYSGDVPCFLRLCFQDPGRASVKGKAPGAPLRGWPERKGRGAEPAAERRKERREIHDIGTTKGFMVKLWFCSKKRKMDP
jgi:hypothetical protein